MPHAEASIEINRTADDVFAIVHDYNRRLHWDTLLKSAVLTGGADKAGPGVRSVCTGKWMTGGIAMETEYVSFTPGSVAAVKLTNRPLLFQTFAATIRHKPLAEGRSQTTYIYNFEARPAWLRWLLHPVMQRMLLKETRRRLQALKVYAENSAGD